MSLLHLSASRQNFVQYRETRLSDTKGKAMHNISKKMRSFSIAKLKVSYETGDVCEKFMIGEDANLHKLITLLLRGSF